MSPKGLFHKIRKKADKEFAAEITAEAKAEKEALKEQKRQQEKQQAIAEYKEKRTLTVEKFFEISGLSMPENLSDISHTLIDQFTADPARLTESSIFMYWGGPQSKKYTSDALAEAAKKNCLLIITDTPCDYPRSLLIEDSHTEESPICTAYINASHYIRSLHKAKVIAITGSVGKTSTKEMVESVLRAHYRQPLVSKGNNNSMFSVTRNIQSLKRFHNVYLQEVGANSPRTVEISARQLEADMVLYTNIGHSHIESYGSREALINDKLSLSNYGKPGGIAFINYDDTVLMSYPFKQRTITYSLRAEGADYYADHIKKSGIGYDFDIVSKNSEGESFKTAARVNALGEHNILNGIAAFAIGRALKISDEEIVKGIAAYRPSGMRQNLIDIGPYHIFADCYNSSLIAIDNTLGAMDQMDIPADGGRKIAVLGDVLELGNISEETHREIGRTVVSHNVDLLLGFGKDMAFACEEALASGKDARFFSERSLLEDEIRQEITPADIILFKASHGINIGATMDRLFGTDINESTQIGHKMFYLKTEGDFEFYIFDCSASVKRYLGSDENPKVPAYVKAAPFSAGGADGAGGVSEELMLPVEKIGKTAFRGMNHVKTVTLPEGIIRIRDGAFKGSGLTGLSAPYSLLSIGNEAFADCPELERVILPETILQIGEKVLENSPRSVLEYK